MASSHNSCYFTTTLPSELILDILLLATSLDNDLPLKLTLVSPTWASFVTSQPLLWSDIYVMLKDGECIERLQLSLVLSGSTPIDVTFVCKPSQIQKHDPHLSFRQALYCLTPHSSRLRSLLMLRDFGPRFHITPALTLCTFYGEGESGVDFPELPIPATIYHLRLPGLNSFQTLHPWHNLRSLFIDCPDVNIYPVHRDTVAFPHLRDLTLINTGSTSTERIISCIDAKRLESIHLIRDIRRDEGRLNDYLRLMETIWTFSSLRTLNLEWLHPLKGGEQDLETLYDSSALRELDLTQGGPFLSCRMRTKPSLHTLYLPLITFTTPGTTMILEQNLLSTTPYLRNISLASQIHWTRGLTLRFLSFLSHLAYLEQLEFIETYPLPYENHAVLQSEPGLSIQPVFPKLKRLGIIGRSRGFIRAWDDVVCPRLNGLTIRLEHDARTHPSSLIPLSRHGTTLICLMLVPCPPVLDFCEFPSLLELGVATDDFAAVAEKFHFPVLRRLSIRSVSSVLILPLPDDVPNAHYPNLAYLNLCDIFGDGEKHGDRWRSITNFTPFVTQQSSIRNLVLPRNSLEHWSYLDELMWALDHQPGHCPELVEISSFDWPTWATFLPALQRRNGRGKAGSAKGVAKPIESIELPHRPSMSILLGLRAALAGEVPISGWPQPPASDKADWVERPIPGGFVPSPLRRCFDCYASGRDDCLYHESYSPAVRLCKRHATSRKKMTKFLAP